MKRCKKAKSFVFLTLFVISLCLFSSETPLKADWKSDANARIEQNRKRNAEITVVDALDQPISGINVQISQKKHRFAFGTCIAYSPLLNTANYRNYILDHFEWAVCENESKWQANEGTRDVENYTQADYIYNWCNNNGITMRGHCLFWEQTSMVPSWATSLGCSDLQLEVNERIDSAVAHFTNKFRHWDVDNEMLSNDFFGPCLGNQGRANMFIRANQVDPDCKLFMNEYNGNSFGGYDAGPYVTRTNQLIALGAPIHGIGIQGHVASPFNPESYWTNVLERLRTGLGLPIWVTEYDVEAANVTQRATDLENFYRICFSHPSVEGIIMWGFWDGSQWRADAQLVEQDWTINAAGQRYEALMDEWTTNDANITDLDGSVDFRGFHGTYQITLSSPGQTAEVYTIELEPGTTLVEFEIETALVPPGPDNDPPTPDPLEWAIAPHATGSTSIAMTAATAADPYGVEYYFDCLTPGGHDANWQNSPIYQDAGLNPNTQYTYRVQARDKSPNHNETDWTTELSATTEPPATDIEVIGSWVSGTTHLKELGLNRSLAFVAHAEHTADTSLTSVTYGGQPMTKVIERSISSGSPTTYAYVVAFILNDANVAAASTSTFVPTWSVTPSAVGYSSVFLGNVNQTVPVETSDSNGTTTLDPIKTNPLSTGDGDMVIEAATCGNSGSYTLSAGFTEGIDQTMATTATGVTGHKSTTGVPETPNADYSAAINRQVIIGFVLKAAPIIGYQNCAAVQAADWGLLSDLNHDCYVDYLDLYTIAFYWLHTDCAALGDCEKSDFEPDGDVDYFDFNTFGLQWLLCNDPENPDCTPNWP